MVESPEENEVRHVRFGLLPKSLANVGAGKYWKVAEEIQTAHYPSPELDLDLVAVHYPSIHSLHQSLQRVGFRFSCHKISPAFSPL